MTLGESPLCETIKVSWKGQRGAVNYQYPNGWYFTGEDGNSSQFYEDCSDALDVAIKTLEARSAV